MRACTATKAASAPRPAPAIVRGDRLGSMTAVADSASLAPGLYLVATPIGNLEDITLRALRILKQADLIACEDTRHSQKLFQHYSIATRTVSYHEHNEMTRAPELVLQLEQGARIALVTDAGTPGISDPGFRLIALAIRHHVPVVPVPGASACLAALVASGLPTDAFQFAGFLPAKRSDRRKALEATRLSTATQVFYEAPHRVLEALQDVVEVLGAGRHIVLAREVTKIHEEFLRGAAADVLQTLESRNGIKGELTLLIGKPADLHASGAPSPRVPTVRERLAQIMAEEGIDEKAALKQIARERGISKSEAYREWQRSK